MKTILFAILLTFWTASFAQKFGVDVGYSYTFNRLKVIDEYPVYGYTDTELKQRFFPNISLRPYVKFHKKLFFYFGVDFVRYEFRRSFYFNSPEHINYNIHWIISETQIPVMLRIEAAKFKSRYTLSVYGGMFARFTGSRKRGSSSMGQIGDSGTEMSIREDRQRFTNFLAGFHQTFPFTKCMEGYIDIQLKYMPGYYYGSPNVMRVFLPFHVENKLSFSFTLGISLLKPEKEKVPNVDPTRLED
ncbi:MAG: hypothetical protein K0S33_1153 [Bacteroidetes bacterium]|jgi:hypothetical protein|nr:hypothetical protein [Bacteroidota bacterium]